MNFYIASMLVTLVIYLLIYLLFKWLEVLLLTNEQIQEYDRIHSKILELKNTDYNDFEIKSAYINLALADYQFLSQE